MTTAESPTDPAARSCLAIVLAAGEGTRMRSRRAKVLHEIAGRSLLGHVLAALAAAGADRIAVVIGPGRDDVAAEAMRAAPGARLFTQVERLGTAHAVLAARAALEEGVDDVVVAFADTPLVEASTFGRLRAELAAGADVVGLAFEAADATGYGRMIVRDGQLEGIVEHKDATADQRRITLCNAGLMAFQGRHALALLDRVRNDNAQGEYYLTDLPALAHAAGLRTGVLVAPEAEVQGINDRVQLAQAERTLQARLREGAMRAGVTLHLPETVYLSHDTKLARDVVIEPHVVFGTDVTVGEGAVIHAHSHLEGAVVGEGASVGPFARLRPGTVMGAKAKVGNFVELKATTLGDAAKVNHLSYVGDASVGAGANIGAGTITCNYDGFSKFRTVIGAGAFIGSNSSLVAPVTIADGGYVGSGSVVTRDVPADALAVARGRQVNVDGWAARFRASRAGAKG